MNPMTVSVTGASGYIASWVVKKLLDHGHTVHATVRDKNNTNKVNHLLKFGLAHPGRLKLFNADLLSGGFDEAFEGCDAVIHMASPFIVGKVKDPKKELVDPAVQGTATVLAAVNASPKVKKVILTSSMVAIYNDAIEASKLPERKFTPEHWNTKASLHYQPYNYSKTEAEKLAWRMEAEQDRWTLSTVHPGFVMGPSLSTRTDGASIEFMLRMLRGEFKLGAPLLYFALVDVRDVAETHIHALETENSAGRYISVCDVKSIVDMAEITQRVTENVNYPLPASTLPGWLVYIFGPLRGLSWKQLRRNLNKSFSVDKSKTVGEIGVRFRPLEETFRDMVLQLERDDLVH